MADIETQTVKIQQNVTPQWAVVQMGNGGVKLCWKITHVV